MTNDLTINGPESREKTAGFSLDYLVAHNITPCSLSTTTEWNQAYRENHTPVIEINDAKLILDYFIGVFKRSPRETREQLRFDLTSRIDYLDKKVFSLAHNNSPKFQEQNDYRRYITSATDLLVKLARSLSPGEESKDFVQGDELGNQSLNLWQVSRYFDYYLGIDTSKLKIKKPSWVGSKMPAVRPIMVRGSFAQMARQIEHATEAQVPFQFEEMIGGTLKQTLKTERGKQNLLRFAEAYAQHLYLINEFTKVEARQLVLSNISTGYGVMTGDASLMFLDMMSSAVNFEKLNRETPILQRAIFEELPKQIRGGRKTKSIGGKNLALTDEGTLTIDVPCETRGEN